MSADLQFKSFIDRVLRLKEEQDTISDDIKEVYAEAKGVGYDKTAMGAFVAELRKREKSPEKFDEASTVLDLYRDAYRRASGTVVATHTHEKPHSSEASSQATTKAGAEPPPAPAAHSSSVVEPQTPPATDQAGDDAKPLPPSPATNPALTARTTAEVTRMLRPNCLHADDLEHCGGQGSKHCSACLKATAEEGAAA